MTSREHEPDASVHNDKCIWLPSEQEPGSHLGYDIETWRRNLGNFDLELTSRVEPISVIVVASH